MINVIEDITKKYNMEKNDIEWLKIITEEYESTRKENENLIERNNQLRKALVKTLRTINETTKGYLF